jgi:preprotein translocase subunit SecY
MWEKIRVLFTIPELKKRIVLTFLLLGIYRVGYQIPLPVLNQMAFGTSSGTEGGLGKLMQQASLFSAANLKQITIFGLGIMPYISASIILQLLSSVWPPLEALRKEGEAGRKKINEYTRYLTVILCLIQSSVYLWQMSAPSSDPALSTIHPVFMAEDATTGLLTGMYWGWFATAILIMTCGTVFLMWVGEQIDEYGVGNGISLLIMAGILAQMPSAVMELVSSAELRLTRFDGIGIESLILMLVLFIAVVFGVVFITLGKRSIQVQSAKHVRGRRVFGGNRQGLLLRINQSGVMPIIFASSLLMFPSILFSYAASGLQSQSASGGFFGYAYQFFALLSDTFSRGTSIFYNLLYIAMIFFFCYFWTAITFNPKEMAENLKDYGTFIPGYRPGRRTADYLESVMNRITYVGAAFLSLVAIVPNVVSTALHIPPAIASFYGGTALLIAVSVAFDIVQKLDSHLVMRNYRGLLEA